MSSFNAACGPHIKSAKAELSRRQLLTAVPSVLAMPYILIPDCARARTHADLAAHFDGLVNSLGFERAVDAVSRLKPWRTIAGISTNNLMRAARYVAVNGGFINKSTSASAVYAHQEGKVMFAAYAPDGLNCVVPLMNARFHDVDRISKIRNCPAIIAGPSLVCLSVTAGEIYKVARSRTSDPTGLCRKLLYPELESRRGVNTFEACDVADHKDIYDGELGHVEIDYLCDRNGGPLGTARSVVRLRTSGEIIAQLSIDYNL